MSKHNLLKRLWTAVGISCLLLASLSWASSEIAESAVAQEGTTPEATLTFTPPPGAVVYAVLFYSTSCPHCHEVMVNYLPPVMERYGERLKVISLDIGEPQNSQLLQNIVQQAGLGNYGVPFMVIGSQILIGSGDIPQRFEQVVDAYLSAGGVGPLGGPIPTPTPDKEPGPVVSPVESPVSVPTSTSVLTPTPTPTPSPVPEDKTGKTIAVAYFYAAGCKDCDKAAVDLNYLKSMYPQVVIQEFDIDENQPLNACLSRDRDVPRERWLASPSVFVGDDVLLPENLDPENLLALAEKYAGSGAEPAWEGYDLDRCRELVKGEFETFSLLTVAGAGIVDGLNPCAFATIVFFISYLSFTGRRGRDILLVGCGFALGIFVTYFLIGLGLGKVAEAVDALGLAPWLYGFIAALCLVLAIVSLGDYIKARRGNVAEMALRLPMRLRRQINRLIRESAQVQAWTAAAFITGVIVSLIELACTGQVYLPTIIYVMGDPNLRTQAVFYLALYNVAFILPLVAVFILAFFGTTSEQLGQFVNRRASTVKLMTAVIFLVLAGWLTYNLVQLVPGLNL